NPARRRERAGGGAGRSRGEPAHPGDPLRDKYRDAAEEGGGEAAWRRDQGLREVGADGRTRSARWRRDRDEEAGHVGGGEALVGLAAAEKNASARGEGRRVAEERD